MPVEMKMWRIDGGSPQPLAPASIPTERELHGFLERDPSLLGERLLVIGSEVPTPYGGRLDLLAVDADGNLHVLELKRDRTPREVVAQILDYGSWVTGLSREAIIEIANKHLDRHFEAAFDDVFGTPPPDELNGELQLTIVAAQLDSSSERIVTYLRGFGVPVNAVFFSYLEDEGRRYLARSWLALSDEATNPSTTKVRRSKRATWNGQDWYVSFGGSLGRKWEDARRYGFISAGGGKFYTQSIRTLPEGGRVWVNLPGTGYVAVGTTLGPAERFQDANVLDGDHWVRLADQRLDGEYDHRATSEDDDEWVVPVQWRDARPESEAYWTRGMFANQHSACKLRQEFTLERLAKHFGIGDDT